MATNDHAEPQANDKINKFAQVLYGVLFFNIFSLQELRDIVGEERLIKWKRFNKGDLIFKEGAFDQHFYIVIQGNIEIRKAGGEHKNGARGMIQTGEVFGELVVCDPEKPRRASAYVTGNEAAVVCEIDATLITKVPDNIKAKFMKKFLDLVVGRLNRQEARVQYYDDVLHYAKECRLAGDDEYFTYAMETAVNDQNRLTQFIKYTDFLISKKISPENACALLERLLFQATQELEENFQAT